MSYAVSQCKNDLAGILHSTSITRLTNPDLLLARAARELLAEIDPAETKRRAELTLYQEIYDYTPPADLKGDKILDIRPQVRRTERENFSKAFNEPFDLQKEDMTFTVEHNNASSTLRVKKSLSGHAVLHDMDDDDSNGAWVVEGGASNLTVDEIIFTQGGASLNFDVGASGGAIANSTMVALDMSTGDEIDDFFCDVYLPDASIVTNVIARWGSSTANYWSRTVTAPVSGSFQNGWNTVRFVWNGATETGTVDPASIRYARIFVTTTTADTDIRVDNLRFIRPHLHSVLYYSKFLFRDSASSWAENVTNDDTLVNLDTDSYNLFLYEAARLAAQQLMTSDPSAARDFDFFSRVLTRGYARYKKDYPSENIKVEGTYYSIQIG